MFGKDYRDLIYRSKVGIIEVQKSMPILWNYHSPHYCKAGRSRIMQVKALRLTLKLVDVGYSGAKMF